MPFSNTDRLEISPALRRLNLETTESGCERLIGEMVESHGPRIVSFMNAHTFNMAWQFPAVRLDIHESTWILRDGIGIALLLRMAGRHPGLNLNGTDFIPKLLSRFVGRKVVFAGSSSPWIGRAAENAGKLFQVDVVEVMDGFQEDRCYVEMVAHSEAEMVILAMGTPKQERVATLLKKNLDRDVLIVCGGGVLDFIGEKVFRAPGWAQSSGLEWVFRLVQEFRRLWFRYLVGNPVFLIRAFLTRKSIYAKQ